jgi:hypothetical protein
VGQFEFFIGLDEYFTFLYFFFNLDQFRPQVNLSERSEQKNKKTNCIEKTKKKLTGKSKPEKQKKNSIWIGFSLRFIKSIEPNRTGPLIINIKMLLTIQVSHI